MGRFKEKTPPPLFIELHPDYLICGECQQLLVYLMCRREILGFPLPAQRKKVAVRPDISRSAVDHGSDRAGEFFIIHTHFLSNKKNELPVHFYTDSPSWLSLLPLQKPIIEFSVLQTPEPAK